MKRPAYSWPARRQRGVAAIEMAFMLPVMIAMLAAPLLFGRVFYNYEVTQRAAHDAAVYLSTVPLIEMKTPAQMSNEAALAAAIVAEETATLNPGSPLLVSVQCDGGPCAWVTVPPTVRVLIRFGVTDNVFTPYTSFLYGDDGIALQADITMRYVGK